MAQEKHLRVHRPRDRCCVGVAVGRSTYWFQGVHRNVLESMAILESGIPNFLSKIKEADADKVRPHQKDWEWQS